MKDAQQDFFREYVFTRMCPMPRWIISLHDNGKKTNIVDNTREGDITGILLGVNLHRRLFLLRDFEIRRS